MKLWANSNMQNIDFMKIIFYLCRFGLAFVWLVSGFVKLTDSYGTQQAIIAYELIPIQYAPILAVVLPVVEIFLGLLLLAGIFIKPVAIASIVMFVVFIIAIGSALVRGLVIDCGCFGTTGDASKVNMYLAIFRDFGFILMAWLLLIKEPDKVLSEK